MGGFGGPKGKLEVRTLQRRVDKCLLARDATLWSAHCPTSPPVTPRKSFCMLWTAKNKCGVFAGIGAILTGRKKTAILCSRMYEEVTKLRLSGGVYLHVI